MNVQPLIRSSHLVIMLIPQEWHAEGREKNIVFAACGAV